MVHSDDEDEDLPGEDKNPSSHGCRVAELLQTPGVLERWRLRCQESFQECRQRHEKHDRWAKARAEYIKRANRPRKGREVPPGDCDGVEEFVPVNAGERVDFIKIRFPSHLQVNTEPKDEGPLPFSSRYTASIADCYFILALLHNSERRSGRIQVFSPEHFEGEFFYHAQRKHVAHFTSADQLSLSDCLARVVADLQLLDPRRAGDTIRALPRGRRPDPVKQKCIKFAKKLKDNGKTWAAIADAVWYEFHRRLKPGTIRGYVMRCRKGLK